MAIHRNGTATSVRVHGVEGRQSSLNGPGFQLLLDSDDTGIVASIDGRPAPEQVLRLLAQQDALSGAETRVDVTIDTTAGHDRYIFTPDLEHRLLFTRAWNRQGLTGVFYGLNPFRADTEGPVGKIPPRPSFRNIVGALARRGAVAEVHIMNLFTRRTPDSATLLADLHDRVASPELERQTLMQADYIVPAWGSAVRRGHMPAVRDLLRELVDLGKAPHLRAKDGQILTAGDPAQPAHARTGGYRDVELVPAPKRWLAGGDLPAALPPADRSVEAPSAKAPIADQPDATSAANPPADAPATPVYTGRPDTPTPSRSPMTTRDTGVDAWTERRPRRLSQELVAAGLEESTATQVADLIRNLHQDGRYEQAIDALRVVLRGDMPILLEHGSREAALWEVLPKLITATRDASQIAQSLLVGAVCSGGVGEYAAFLECSQPGINGGHKNREGLYPVPGIKRPQDTRLAYARLDGYSGPDDSKGTAARGDGRTLNSKAYPTPAQRYGWNARRESSRQLS